VLTAHHRFNRHLEIMSRVMSPGVLPGVLAPVRDTFLPGDSVLDVDDEDVLAFLCHLGMGALVIGMSNFKMPWMSFSKPN